VNKIKSIEIRSKFIEFFERNNHKKVISSSLVPENDNSILFTNAGMIQFKDIFLGNEEPIFRKVTSSQKCVRAGGKHNDLENVGYTARHHTFFEMLGNFSFGDYFKEEAISMAWKFLTKELELPKDKLWITIYKDDNDSFKIWNEKIGIDKSRIVRMGEKDNFWSIGDEGPCGPCSEIIFDQGDMFKCDNPNCSVGCDCDRYLELWNLVFMQYNKSKDGTMVNLPKPSIDTGMGLERITAVIQNTKTNFDTDLFGPIIEEICKISGKYYFGENVIPIRVVADHIRSITFLIADQVLPSNEGRGYVLRRIIRRAVIYGKKLGIENPFLHFLSKIVIKLMEDIYPELKANEDLIFSFILNEEKIFNKTLRRSTKTLDKIIEKVKRNGDEIIQGGDIFILYDTYGLPIDVMTNLAKENNLLLDIKGFEDCMKEQKQRSKENRRKEANKNL